VNIRDERRICAVCVLKGDRENKHTKTFSSKFSPTLAHFSPKYYKSYSLTKKNKYIDRNHEIPWNFFDKSGEKTVNIW
jgi:hypothetical protein